MAYSYYRRRYYRRRPRRYVRRWFRRRFRRFVNGSSKSLCRVKIPVSTTIAATQAANTKGTTVMSFASFAPSNAWGSPLSSGLYRIYADLYDEVKCIGMKFKLNVSNPIGTSEIPSLQIYSAFDRRYGSGEAVPTFNNLSVYSTAAVATAVNNSVAKVMRSIYASDLMEKAQWHDASLSLAGGVYADDAYTAAGLNPNFFVPALLLAFCVPNAPANQSQTINATLDVTYYFAFRNPKYGGSAGNSKGDVAVEPGRMADEDDGLNVADMIADDEPSANALTAEEQWAKQGYDTAVAELEKRRSALKSKRAATSSRQPVTKTV